MLTTSATLFSIMTEPEPEPELVGTQICRVVKVTSVFLSSF
jgi:hypothetical protein